MVPLPSFLTAGFMQAALHKNMQGINGLQGWQWLFIFNSISSSTLLALLDSVVVDADLFSTFQ
jgi:hypothetical protein